MRTNDTTRTKYTGTKYKVGKDVLRNRRDAEELTSNAERLIVAITMVTTGALFVLLIATASYS